MIWGNSYTSFSPPCNMGNYQSQRVGKKCQEPPPLHFYKPLNQWRLPVVEESNASQQQVQNRFTPLTAGSSGISVYLRGGGLQDMYGLTWKLLMHGSDRRRRFKDTPEYTLPMPASFLVVCSSGLRLLRPKMATIFSDYIPP